MKGALVIVGGLAIGIGLAYLFFGWPRTSGRLIIPQG